MDLLDRAKVVDNLDHLTKLIEEGGLTLNFKKVTNPLEEIDAGGHILSNNLTFLRIGKKNNLAHFSFFNNLYFIYYFIRKEEISYN